MTFADHFSTVAKQYARFRPVYPSELGVLLASRCSRRVLAWDVGCGNGQLAGLLASHFERVIATDPSQAQLDEARPDPRIEYRCAIAEESGLPDGCVDLAVAAQAAHWFDWPRYVGEVERVTRPGALIALVGYGVLRLPAEDPCAAIVDEYYSRDVAPYWPPARAILEHGYRDLVWPWQELDAPSLELATSWTREQMAAWIATWSATVKLIAAEGPAKYDALCGRLAARWPDGERRQLRVPLDLRLARR